jgi:nucleoside-diphosphate-sugar epimerase
MGDGHTKILILGAGGQIGLELTETLRAQHSTTDVIASDIRQVDQLAGKGPFELLDVLDREAVYDVVRRHGITEIYHLAAVLSATGEKNPAFAWKLNMDGLLHVLDACRDLGVKKLFWPSSIAVFGPDTPRHNTPQSTVMNPNTVYGISKQAGELWCAYYHAKFGVDVRSIRYPGLIGYKSLPGGGTTDYAVDIYHQALAKGSFDCFLNADTALPMMYMPDAIRATLELMAAPAASITVRSSYNLGGISFTPREIAAAIQKHLANFTCTYTPDPLRQNIANSWPASIDDSKATADWNWHAAYDLDAMTADMLLHLSEKA